MSDKNVNLTDDVDLLSVLQGEESETSSNTTLNEEPKEEKSLNQNLLEMLGAEGDTDVSDLEQAMSESDEEEANRKMQEIHDIAQQLTNSTTGQNVGSGDIDQDLANWFDGKDMLPSDDLTGYVSNPTIKMEHGLTRNTLAGYTLMGKLRKFIEEDAFDMLFSEQALLGLDPEDIEARVKTAFTMYDKLAVLNAKIINDTRNLRLKSNIETDQIDRLSMLLSTIPTEKLEEVLKGISKK